MVLAAALVGVPGGHVASVLPSPSGAAIKGVEYHRAGLGHYFVTASDYEQQLDSGRTRGWARTGGWFDAETPNAATSTASPVCRFYGRTNAGLDSHSCAAWLGECAAVVRTFAAFWLDDYGNVFRVNAADPVTGVCREGAAPVHRAFDKRRDLNHQCTMRRAVRDRMVATDRVNRARTAAYLTVRSPRFQTEFQP